MTGAAAAALSQERVAMAVLVDFFFTLPVRLTTAGVDITYAGNNYVGVGGLGTISEIEDSPGEHKNISLQLSGVPLEVMAIALNEDVRNKPITLRLATMDPDSLAVLDAPLIWAGTVENMPLQISNETVTVTVVAEHRAVTFGRPKSSLYTDADQRKLFPGDTSLRFIQSQSTHNDVWPAAAYFRQ
jgi:hypothetical protein